MRQPTQASITKVPPNSHFHQRTRGTHCYIGGAAKARRVNWIMRFFAPLSGKNKQTAPIVERLVSPSLLLSPIVFGLLGGRESTRILQTTPPHPSTAVVDLSDPSTPHTQPQYREPLYSNSSPRTTPYLTADGNWGLWLRMSWACFFSFCVCNGSNCTANFR